MLGGWRSEADKFPFLPCCDLRFEWQLSEMDYAQWYVRVFVTGGKIPVQPSQACNSENGLVHFQCTSITGDEEGEQELLFSALLESHIPKKTRNSVKVEEKGRELQLSVAVRQSQQCCQSGTGREKNANLLQFHFYYMHQVWNDTDLHNSCKS